MKRKEKKNQKWRNDYGDVTQKKSIYTNVGADFIQFSKNKKPQISNRMTKMSLLNSSNYTIKIHHHILFVIWPCRFKTVKALPIAYCWARLRFQFEPILNRLMRCNRLLDKDLFKCRLSECWTIPFFFLASDFWQSQLYRIQYGDYPTELWYFSLSPFHTLDFKCNSVGVWCKKK